MTLTNRHRKQQIAPLGSPYSQGELFVETLYEIAKAPSDSDRKVEHFDTLDATYESFHPMSADDLRRAFMGVQDALQILFNDLVIPDPEEG